jgi:hypothetical protein
MTDQFLVRSEIASVIAISTTMARADATSPTASAAHDTLPMPAPPGPQLLR